MSEANNNWDVIIIGGGINGSLAAATLANEGVKTVLFEKNDETGGLANTSERMPGYHFNRGAWLPAMVRWNPGFQALQPDVRHPVKYVTGDPKFLTMDPNTAEYFFLYDKLEDTLNDIRRFSGEHDAQAWQNYADEFGWMLDLLLAVAFQPAPTNLNDLLSLMPAMDEMDTSEEGNLALLDLARTALMSLDQMLDERFDHNLIKTLILKFGDTMGSNCWDYASGLWGIETLMCNKMEQAVGGTGAVCDAIVATAEDEGATIRRNACVEEIIVENGRAVGVRLANGEEHFAKSIISNLDCKGVFTELINGEEQEKLDPQFMRRIRCLKSRHTAMMEVHFAISELPDFTSFYKGIDNEKALNAMWVVGGGTEYTRKFQLERESGRIPKEPVWMGHVPSYLDPTLAPEGKHCLTMGIISGDYLEGRDWDEAKEELADNCTEQLFRMAPNLRNAVIERIVDSPKDNAMYCGAEHGNMYGIDQSGLAGLLMFRPLPELATGRTPVEGLYLASSATYPFGGVMAAGGYNTAKQIADDFHANRGDFAK